MHGKLGCGEQGRYEKSSPQETTKSSHQDDGIADERCGTGNYGSQQYGNMLAHPLAHDISPPPESTKAVFVVTA